jgi:hypothetical protein
MTTCFDVDQAKHQAAEMACQLLAQICAEADENREKSR